METLAPFSIARLPRLVFGAGTVASLPAEARRFGTRALLVTGARSFRESPHRERLERGLEAAGMTFEAFAVRGEPSPELVDQAVAHFRAENHFDLVIGIGGGSALDAAKAIAGLLRPGNSVMDHLEGVGPERPYDGPALPFIAVPTTAGSGSEATKNAVLSRPGPDGFKKSFRDDALVARLAVVDPDLLATCPRDVMAADGMDAFTQLLESVVSLRSNPMTEALAWSGLEAVRGGFFAALDGEDAGRARMAYGSLMSGVCLAQTGLGSVHGLAQPLGSLFPIPHGVVCGTLVAEATAVNLAALRARDPAGPALKTYERAGRVLFGTDADGLVARLREWTAALALPRLGAYGVGPGDVARIVAGSRGSSMKTNPVALTDAEIADLVVRRL